jgi:hypothetical protein
LKNAALPAPPTLSMQPHSPIANGLLAATTLVISASV